MPTVADVLEMEELAGAIPVAGAAGLNRPVAWVHVSPVPDAPNWLNGGELVLTTALNLPRTIDEQRAYVRALAAKPIAGLILAVGSYIDAAPPHMREEADALAFPLIEIPYQARFVDIARAVNERIAQANMTVTEQALAITRVLTQLVLDGGTQQDLAETMAKLIGHSVSIENDRFESLAVYNVAPVDEARRYTQEQQRTNPTLLAALEQQGIFATIRRTLRPVALPVMPEVGLELERILAPIVVHGDIYGYMWIIAADKPLTILDQLAIESGATIAALMLLYQETAQNTEASLKGGLLTRLLQADRPAADSALIDEALRYGVRFDAPYAVIVIDPGGAALLRRVNRRAAGQHGEKWRAVIGEFAGQIVLLTPLETASTAADPGLLRLVSQLGELAEDRQPLRIGISGAAHGSGSVRAAYDQARDALLIAGRLGLSAAPVYFDQLGYLYTLYRAGTAALHAHPTVPLLRRLAAEPGADLFHTLETFVDAGGSGVKTAEELNIHRSTLNYRLDRITALTGLDLTDPQARTNVQVALKLYRLFNDA